MIDWALLDMGELRYKFGLANVPSLLIHRAN